MDLHTWLSTRVDAIERLTETTNDPELVASSLRRCDADRRILARHNVDPEKAADRLWATACQGCGYYDTETGDPAAENINDCLELLDLAHAHGLNEAEIAALDRPEPPPVVYSTSARSIRERLAELVDQHLDAQVSVETPAFADSGVAVRLTARKISAVLHISEQDLDNL